MKPSGGERPLQSHGRSENGYSHATRRTQRCDGVGRPHIGAVGWRRSGARIHCSRRRDDDVDDHRRDDDSTPHAADAGVVIDDECPRDYCGNSCYDDVYDDDATRDDSPADNYRNDGSGDDRDHSVAFGGVES